MHQNLLQPAFKRENVRNKEKKLTDASQIFTCKIHLTKLHNAHTHTHRDPHVIAVCPTLPKATCTKREKGSTFVELIPSACPI